MGFDVDEVQRRLAVPIDLPIHLSRMEFLDNPSHPASGYTVDSRMKLSLAVIGTYLHGVRDDSGCDGVSGPLPNGQLYACVDAIKIPVTINFATDDGAVHGTALGDATQQNGSHELWRSMDLAARVDMHGFANLHEVTGSLQLYPPKAGSRTTEASSS
ncbi:MAG: hypothetical protein JWN04_4140 [Myxococcaceae bacterium]|nr:hypothetical protein [Myxococcaceae bacterium]